MGPKTQIALSIGPRQSLVWQAFLGVSVAAVIVAVVVASLFFNQDFLRTESRVTAANFSMEFVNVPAGSFWMGCAEGDADCSVSEEPRRQVTITMPFELGKYEVTQEQWQALMGKNPSFFPAARNPVEFVSWNEVQEFLEKLNARNDGYLYRLPAEAEWEYAARAGTTGKYYGNLDAIAWSGNNSGSKPRQVGTKQANAWGLYDMLGNVWEWCQDWHAIDYYSKGVNQDPPGPDSGSYKVVRGGSWERDPRFLRLSHRDSLEPVDSYSYVGFRCLRERR